MPPEEDPPQEATEPVDLHARLAEAIALLRGIEDDVSEMLTRPRPAPRK